MQQPLTISIISYFRNIHKLELNTSNAISLLSTLKHFKTLHEAHKEKFTNYHGMTFDGILEYIEQDIHRIEQLHFKYKSLGYLLTDNTKQYDVETKIKLDKEDINSLAQKAIDKILDGEKTPKKLSYKEQVQARAEQLSKETKLDIIKKTANKKS